MPGTERTGREGKALAWTALAMVLASFAAAMLLGNAVPGRAEFALMYAKGAYGSVGVSTAVETEIVRATSPGPQGRGGHPDGPWLGIGVSAVSEVNVSRAVPAEVAAAVAAVRPKSITIGFGEGVSAVSLSPQLAPGPRKDWGWQPEFFDGAMGGVLFANLSAMGGDYIILDSVDSSEFFGGGPGYFDLSFAYKPSYEGHLASVAVDTFTPDGEPDQTMTVALTSGAAEGTGDFYAVTQDVGGGWKRVMARNIAEVPGDGSMVVYLQNIPTVGSEPFALYLDDVEVTAA